MDGETVGKKQCFTLTEVRCDVLVINSRNHGIRCGYENDICQFYGLRRVIDLEAELLGNLARLRLRIESDDDLEAAILEVKCVGVAL